MTRIAGASLLVTLGVASGLKASTIGAFSDNFNTPGTFATEFTVYNSGVANTSIFQQSSGGLSASGSISSSTNSDPTAVLQAATGTFDLSAASGTAYTLTAFFQDQSGVVNTAPTGVPVSALQLGFLQGPTQSFNGAAAGNSATFVSARLTSSGTLQVQTAKTGTTTNGTASSAVSLVAGNWYEMLVTIQSTATAGTYNVGATVFNSDSSGNVGTTAINLTAANYVVGADLGATAYFGARINDATTGTAGATVVEAAAVDNVSVSSSPEPASLGLLGLGAIGMLARRRRA